jgi:oligoendopeptidase F
MATATKIPAAPTWDLESIFPGGSGSPKLKEFRTTVRANLTKLTDQFKSLPATLDKASLSAWRDFVVALQKTGEELELVRSFSSCLLAQNVADDGAQAIGAEADELSSIWDKAKAGFAAMAAKQTDAAWNDLMGQSEISSVAFFLNEVRDDAREKMSSELETLALGLAVNGYHAWNRLYDKMAGDLRVDFEANGEKKQLSLGQLHTYMDNPDRSIRKKAFDKLVEAWSSRADLAAMALNAQAGFRLSLYENRGWKSTRHEPLKLNRLKQETLDTMWHVIGQNTSRLKPYIEAKKKVLGIDKYRWYDESVACDRSERKFPYDEAVEFIVENAASFSPHLADFCRMATSKRWIEAEDRAGKAAGGFCTFLGLHRQSRIFMTYAGTFENLMTLSHELGHGYHSHVLSDRPYFSMWYPMGLAETASIFNELLTCDAALKQAKSPDEKLMLTDQVLGQAYTFFCNIQSRYLFDCAFYEERRAGVVPRERLNELMIEAQKKAFGSLLDESGYHPMFWASKLHFFITDTPFYNFPYTFGYLFAGGVYARAKDEGKSFADKYRALLADTGGMTTEQLAQKHLGVDLTKEDFWVSAVNRSLSQVDTFVGLAGK